MLMPRVFDRQPVFTNFQRFLEALHSFSTLLAHGRTMLSAIFDHGQHLIVKRNKAFFLYAQIRSPDETIDNNHH